MFKFDPYSADVDANPFPLYKILRDEYPCYFSEEGNCWVLSRYQDIVDANNNHDIFSSAQGNAIDDTPERAGSTLGTTDPPKHDRLRRLINFAFLRRNVEQLEEPCREISIQWLSQSAPSGKIDLIFDYITPVTVGVLAYLLGIPPEDHRKIKLWVNDFFKNDPTTRRRTEVALKAQTEIFAYAKNLIEDRTKNPRDDLISFLIQAEDEGQKLSDHEVHMISMTLIVAGVESATSFFGLLAKNLFDYPKARAQLADDISLVPMAIEESLRLNTSAQRFRRTLTQNFELHSNIMRSGDKVLMAYGSGNRDERRWENPDGYDLGRDTRGHLGLGTGVHVCIGAPIAKLINRIGAEELIKLAPNYRQIKADDQLEWLPSPTFRSMVNYEIAFE
jgi:cytochrome P450